MKRGLSQFLALLLALPAAAATLTPAQLEGEINAAITNNNSQAITGLILNGILNDMVDSFAPIGTTPQTSASNTWIAPQTFAVPPIIATLNGYLKANGVSVLTASPTIPATDITGLAAVATSGSASDLTAGELPLARNTSSAFPGLSASVQGTGVPGLDGAKWMIWNRGAFDPKPILRVDRHMDTGSAASVGTYKGIWGLCSSNPNNIGYEWCGTFELHNDTLASTGAQNVAINGTAFKEANGIGAIGPTWGSNFNCTDLTQENDPVASCVGSEIDAGARSTVATTDAHKQRVILHLAAQSITDGTHIGRGLLISPDNTSIIDNAIEILDKTHTSVFLVEGAGNTTISSNIGGWGSTNVGKTLILKPETGAGANPAIGILDLNSANGWAMVNASGELRVNSMPALSDSVTAPLTAIAIAHSTGMAAFGAQLKLKSYTIAGLPTCDAASLGAIAVVSNGTAFGTGIYGSAVSATGAVTRKVLCTNTAGPTTYDWAYD